MSGEDLDIHPRLLARRRIVALDRGRDILLTALVGLITSLDYLVQTTGRFSVEAEMVRNLYSQAASVEVYNDDTVVLLDQVMQKMANIHADLLASDLMSSRWQLRQETSRRQSLPQYSDHLPGQERARHRQLERRRPQ